MAKSSKKEYYSPNKGITVSDENAISSIKLEQELDIINNGRLGNYNDQGQYFFDRNIAKELIRCKKHISKYVEANPLRNGYDTYFLYTLLPGFDNIEFILEANKNFARLLILEKVIKEGGQYFDIFEEEVIKFDIDKKVTLDYIKNVLRIIDDVDGEDGKKFEDDHITLILLRKIYLKEVSDNILSNSVKIERDQFEKAISMLKEDGEYGKRVLQKFIERVNSRQEVIENKDSADYNRSLNEILASVIFIETTDKDLENKNNKQLYSQIFENRVTQLAPVLAESKGAVSTTAVKGKFFDLTHKDLEQNFVDGEIGGYRNSRFVDVRQITDTKPLDKAITSIYPVKDNVLETKKSSIRPRQTDSKQIAEEKPTQNYVDEKVADYNAMAISSAEMQVFERAQARENKVTPPKERKVKAILEEAQERSKATSEDQTPSNVGKIESKEKTSAQVNKMTMVAENSPTQTLRVDKNERSTHGQESKTNIDNSQIINNYFNGLSEEKKGNEKSSDEIKEQKIENKNATLNEEIIQNIIKAKQETNESEISFSMKGSTQNDKFLSKEFSVNVQEPTL